LQRPQKKVLPTIGDFLRCTSVRDIHVPYIYDYIIKLHRRQAEIIHNHENVHNIGQGETPHRKDKKA
jgi:hypothetical protein